MGAVKPFTEDEDNFIRSNYLEIPIKRMGTILGRSGCGVKGRMKKMGLVVPKALAEKRRRDSYFNKGHLVYNKGKKQSEYMTPEQIKKTAKTRFKKGNIPHNANYDGHIRITKDGYKEIRVRAGKYRLLHVVNWESKYGKVPRSHCLRSIDGNPLNVKPANWKLITRIENMLRNSKENYPAEIIPSLVVVNKLKNRIKELEYGKK